MNNEQHDGATPSERYLGRLCKRSFLSLWSYSNLRTDESQNNGKGDGKELCDLLVLFENDVIIFSDKNIKFNRTIDVDVAWKRWYKKAIHRSANQVFGAESFILNHPDRIFLDSLCTKKFPLKFPSKETINIHRVCVTSGSHDACIEYFGGNSLGSLILNSSLNGIEFHEQPFWIGHPNLAKGFIHVFDEFALDVIFSELDTVVDFISYLNKREKLLSKDTPEICAAGEEQILALYLTNMSESHEHDFVFPLKEGEPTNRIWLDESFWEDMLHNPQYNAKKEADKKSYAWDRLIEHLIESGEILKDDTYNQGTIPEIELCLRKMVAEPRLNRRQLSEALLDLLSKPLVNKRMARIVYSNSFPDRAYVFLILPNLYSEEYSDYRKSRRNLLEAYCKVVKLKIKNVKFIIGFATEPNGSSKASEDLMMLDVCNWTEEMQKEAVELQNKFSLLLDNNLAITRGHTSEYPDIEKADIKKNKKNSKKKNVFQKKKTKKKMQKQSRKKNRKK